MAINTQILTKAETSAIFDIALFYCCDISLKLLNFRNMRIVN